MSLKKKLLYICVVFLAFILSACHEQTESIFGTIPGIYEGEMKAVANAAHKQTSNPATILNIMKEMTDSAFEVASQKSQEEVNKLEGMSVNYIVATDVDMEITSDISIEKVILPSITMRNQGMMSVSLSFDAKTKDKKLFYILEGYEGMVGCGIYELANFDNTETKHITMNVVAPNVPAKYQQSCKTIRFVSPMTFVQEVAVIDRKQNQWRKEYNKMMKL